MTPVEVWLALAAFFGTTLTTLGYYRNTANKLEVRTNKILLEKKKIVTKSYENLLEKIFEAYKTERKLGEEHKEELEKIADLSSRLDKLPNDLSEVVDKITFSFISGFSSILFIILLAYIPSSIHDPAISFWAQIIVVAFMSVSFYRYFADGIAKIRSFRNFEKLINAIERSETFKKLYESTEKGGKS